MTLTERIEIDTIDALTIAAFLGENFDAFAAQLGGAEAERIIAALGSTDVEHCEDGGQ